MFVCVEYLERLTMTFLSNTEIKVIGILILVALCIFSLDRFIETPRKIGYDRRTADYFTEENKVLQKVVQENIRITSLLQKAQNDAQQREKENHTLALRNASLLNQLRDSTSRIDQRVPDASIDALRVATTTLNRLFTECREEYAAMGQAASGHSSDVRTLSEAWPSTTPN
jgi:hypothetical protein